MTEIELLQKAKDYALQMWGAYYDDKHPDSAIDESLGELSVKDFIAGYNFALNLPNLQTQTATDRPLKVGDVLVCHTRFRDYFSAEKPYKISNVDEYMIGVIDNMGGEYYFFYKDPGSLYYKNFFTLKP